MDEQKIDNGDEQKVDTSMDPRYVFLLNKLSENRDSLDEMIVTISEARSQIKVLFPEKVDFKNKRHYMEERLKTIACIFGIELDIRKQKEQSIKSEIEIRRRLSGEGENRTLEDLYKDSVALSKALESLEGMSGSGVVEFDGEGDKLDMAPAIIHKTKGK